MKVKIGKVVSQVKFQSNHLKGGITNKPLEWMETLTKMDVVDCWIKKGLRMVWVAAEAPIEEIETPDRVTDGH